MHVVVIGGGAAGLSSALGLARSGHRVTVVERDPAPGDVNIEDAFGRWSRKGVPQIRQGHFILGRAHDMLQQHAPDVIDALAEQGIVPAYSPMLMFLPPTELQPGDELAPTPTRRIPFELTLRRALEREPGAEIRSGTRVLGLSTTDVAGRPRVTSVGLEDGSEIPADFVIDAGGNKSRVGGWLRDAGAVFPPEETEDCNITYFGRYFRSKGEPPDPWALLQSAGQTEYMQFTPFPGDNGTYGICLIPASWDMELRALRDVDAWNLAAVQFPSVAQWTNGDVAEAITDVDVTAGHTNALRPFLNDGVPCYLGSLPVGDALCTVDALTAWGLSIALTHGFAVAKAVSEHSGDPGDAALAYADAVMAETEECFRIASARSRLRTRRWRGEPLDPRDRYEENEVLGSQFTPDVLLSDPVVLRGGLRFINLTGRPSAVFEDAEFMAKLQAAIRSRAGAEAPPLGPPRDELVSILSASSVAVRS